MNLLHAIVAESGRLAALHDLGLLDTAPEVEFDAIARAAAALCRTPIALVGLVDAHRQWFKASHGIAADRAGGDLTFCRHALQVSGVFEVRDARADPRFHDHPGVLGPPGLRFYAAAPLVLSCGQRVGALSVIDTVPRVLDEAQRRGLLDLSLAIASAFERRRDLGRHAGSTALAHPARQALAGVDADACFEALLDVAPVGVIVTDAAGRCLATNRRWQQIHGLRASEALGDGWTSVLHLDDAGPVLGDWHRAAARGAVFEMDYRIELAGGDVRVVHGRSAPILGADGRVACYVGAVEDLSQQRLRDGALLDVLRSRFIVAITGIDGRILEVNPAYEAVSGYGAAELVGAVHRPVLSGIHPPPFFDDLWRTVSSGQTWRGEVCNRHKDGRLYWTDSVVAPLRDATGRIDRFVSICSDVTRRKVQDERLRVSEQLLNRTGEVAGVGGWQVDLRTGHVEWTAQTRRIHGVPDDYVPTLDSAIAFYAPEARGQIAAAVQRAINEGEPWDLSLPFVRTDGARLRVRAVGEAEFEAGRAVRLWGAFRDVTDAVARDADATDRPEAAPPPPFSSETPAGPSL